MAVLQREFDARGWITPDQFAVAYGLARVTPGTNMMAFCAATGWMMLGTVGAIAAVLAVTIPSAALVVWITRLCEAGNQNRIAHAAIAGTVAAAVGMMLAASVNLVRGQLAKRRWAVTVAVVAAAFVLARVLALSPIQVLGIAAVAGALAGRP